MVNLIEIQWFGESVDTVTDTHTRRRTVECQVCAAPHRKTSIRFRFAFLFKMSTSITTQYDLLTAMGMVSFTIGVAYVIERKKWTMITESGMAMILGVY